MGQQASCIAAATTQLDCAVPASPAGRQAANQRGAHWPRWYLADEEGQPAFLRQRKRQCHQGDFALELPLTVVINGITVFQQQLS